MNLRDRLFAFVIGDCHVGCHYRGQVNPQITMRHGEAQRDYLKWKTQKLIEFGIEISYQDKKVLNKRSEGKVYLAYDTRTKHLNILKDVWKIAYPDKTKTYTSEWINPNTIDDFALALWWMDDGSLHYCKRHSANMTGVLCTHCSEEELIVVKNAINKVLDLKENEIRPRRRRIKYYSLYFTTNAYLKLLNKIHKYIHPTMLYKCAVILGEDKRPIIPISAEQLKEQIELKMYSDTLSNKR
jgi:hypothetical protein